MAAAGGALGAYANYFCMGRVLDVGFIGNGILGGLVAITAACDVATQSAALSIGLVAGFFVYPSVSYIMRRLRLDDPVDAAAVHGGCGLFGVLAVGLCRPPCEHLASVGVSLGGQATFCDAGHSLGLQLLCQLRGALVEVLLTAATTMSVFAMFSVSEYAACGELGHLREAEDLLTSMSESPDLLEASALKWRRLAQESVMLRVLLAKHGWTGEGFASGEPTDYWRLRQDLRILQAKKDTSLEGNGHLWNPMFRLGRWLGSSAACRKMALVRLRISPAAELSGLGTADVRGGLLLRHINRTKGKELLAGAEPLQVAQALAPSVAQDVLLQGLMEPVIESSPPATVAGRRGQSAMSTHTYSSTTSIDSPPAYSLHSGDPETPPPTVLGRLNRTMPGPEAQISDANVFGLQLTHWLRTVSTEDAV